MSKTTTPPPTNLNDREKERAKDLTLPTLGHTVSSYSVLGGATALLPLPFVDDWLCRKARRMMFEAILAQHSDKEVAKREGDKLDVEFGSFFPKTLGGLLKWFFFKVLLYPLRKIVRKVLFFLAMRQSVHRTTKLFYEGYLLHFAITEGLYRPKSEPLPEDVAGLLFAIDAAISQSHTTPTRTMLQQLFQGSYGLLAGASLRVWGANEESSSAKELLEQKANPEEKQKLQSILDQMTRVLWFDEQNLRALEEAFQHHLARPPHTYPKRKYKKYRQTVEHVRQA